MKKFLGFFLTIALLFVIASCQASTDKLLNEAKDDLQIFYSTGDNATSVTKKLTLITTGKNEVVITWSSSDTTVIANDGIVTRPAYGSGDKEVTLTANLILGSKNITKEFKVTVLEAIQTDAQKLAAAMDALNVQFAVGDSATAVTSNVTLPATQGEATVTWSSSNPAVISNDGVVSRPKFDENNATVVLTATLTVGTETQTKTFTLVVTKYETILDADAVQNTKEKIILLSGETQAAASFELPVAGAYETTITWESSNPSFIEVTNVPRGAGVKARVVHPDFGAEDVTVTLTATITKNGVTDTRTFDIIVKALTEPQPALYTIADAKAALDATYNPETNKYGTVNVRIQGVVIELAGGRNAYIQDETGAMYLYMSATNPDLAIGNKVEVNGALVMYNGLYEMSKPTAESISINNPLPEVVTYTTIADLVAANAQSKLVHLEGLKIVSVPAPTTGSYSVVVTDGYATIEVRIDKYTLPFIETTNFTVGNTISITAPLSRYNSTFQLMIISTEDMTPYTLTDADMIKFAVYDLNKSMPAQTAANLTLPTTLNGATITWASDNAAITTEGVVTRPGINQPDVDVTLTATISAGTAETVIKTYVVKVLAETPTPIADVKALPAASMVTIRGIVTEVAGNNAYVQDATGAIYLYLGTTNNPNLVIGNDVLVTGTLDIYSGLYQIKNLTVTVLSSGNTLPAATTYTTIANLVAVNPQSKLVHLDGLKIVRVNTPSTAGNSYTVDVTDGFTTISIYVDKYTLPYIDPTYFVVGNGINITAPYGVNKLNVVAVEDMTAYTFTDADKIKFVKYTLSTTIPSQTAENITLPTTLDGVTITWASDNAAITTEGVVTRPAIGQDHAYVNLTATLTIGELTDTKVLPVTVLARQQITDLFFSEYIEGSSNNKALEIYNGTGADVDLSTYKVEVYTNGGTTVSYSLTLSGTLVNGDVYVIYNASAIAAISSVGDISSDVTYYNGDDTIVLKHNDVVIDSIGQIGFDPGTNWNVNGVATSEYTLVRKAYIAVGDTNTSDAYDPSVEWIAYPQNTTTYLGSHTTN